MDVGRAPRGLTGPPQAYHQPPPWPYWFPSPTPPPVVTRDNKEKKDDDPWTTLDAQAAFLGPNLWGAPKDQDLKLQYADLEEFLNESEPVSQPQLRPNALQTVAGRLSQSPPGSSSPPAPAVLSPLHPLPLPPPPQPPPQQPPPQQPPASLGPPQPRDLRDPKRHGHDGREQYRSGQERPAAAERPDTGVQVKVEFQVSPTDLALATVPGVEFDPQTHQFSDEELKPQPMCKKSKKQVVPEERKDQKYWTRRQRNNTAAKRSRDARRLKENQIVLRANFLEKENAALREAMDELTKKNQELKARMVSCHCR